MDRLTIPDANETGIGICFAHPIDLEGAYNITSLDSRMDEDRRMLEAIAERLVAYEDTWLTPEEITALASDRDRWKARAEAALKALGNDCDTCAHGQAACPYGDACGITADYYEFDEEWFAANK